MTCSPPLSEPAPGPDDRAPGVSPSHDPRDWSLGSVRTRPGGFESVYDLLYDEIAAYVLRRTGDLHVTQDLVSEVFLDALAGLAKARNEEAPVRFWILRIATNRVNRWWRGQQRRERLLAVFGRQQVAAPLGSDDEAPDADGLTRALQRLSPPHQSVLSLHYLQGLAVTEIAEVLECAPGTVKSRLARARAAFEQLYAPNEDERR